MGEETERVTHIHRKQDSVWVEGPRTVIPIHTNADGQSSHLPSSHWGQKASLKVAFIADNTWEVNMWKGYILSPISCFFWCL